MTGPNMKRLVATRMAIDAVPPSGGFAAGVAFLMDPERVRTSARKAEEWARASVDAVRAAPPPNSFAGADDEAIAGEILRQAELRKRGPKGGA